jgi:PBP1b-binding outer membrane lipoprotein LpoB
MILGKKLIQAASLLLLISSLLLGGCSDMTPVEPQKPTSPAPTTPAEPSKQTPAVQEFKVTYNYGATGPVELSANNITLKVGQKLILQPASGLTKNTRFRSSGDNFFSDVMEQQGDQNASGQLVFIAKQPGKGKLQIIPNSTEEARAVDFWVTVQ